jgi:DNA-binding XRE family transcriptional regulator
MGIPPLITAAQIRAARGLLNWSQSHLAREAGIARRTLNAAETETAVTKDETITKIARVLRANGVRFVSEGREEGVVLVRHLRGS